MKKKVIIIGVSCLVAVLAILLFTAPIFWGTCKVYFDLNNGLVKKQWDSFGLVYWESIEETDYSKLLKKFELSEDPPNYGSLYVPNTKISPFRKHEKKSCILDSVYTRLTKR